MNVSARELDRVVLETVSEDYESFEAVVSKLSLRLNHSACTTSEIARVERSLLAFIANNLVRAYLIHADPPYATAVGVDLDTVRRYWFCITEEGQDYLSKNL
jgi:hypothetical protein